MIRRLKTKFIVLALTALFLLLSVIVAGMNLLNYNEVVGEADMILSLLSQNHGVFPDSKDGMNDWLLPGMSPELPFETRFFSVLTNGSEEIVQIDTGNIFAIDSESAAQYAQKVLQKSAEKGFVGNYWYNSVKEQQGTRITFLDCGRNSISFGISPRSASGCLCWGMGSWPSRSVSSRESLCVLSRKAMKSKNSSSRMPVMRSRRRSRSSARISMC